MTCEEEMTAILKKQFSTACKILHANTPVGTLLSWIADENSLERSKERYICFSGLLNILCEDTEDNLSG